ncbi:MAG: phenylalanine--tRNA ligase subunit alpha [Oscillospiraceae bacterium]|nr:phenylalanine--tRNA ligase subunit alpha [Oscillospiraceae bacterium]
MKDLSNKADEKKQEFLKMFELLKSEKDLRKLEILFKSFLKDLYSELKFFDLNEKKTNGKIINDFKNAMQLEFSSAYEKFGLESETRRHDPSIIRSGIKFGSVHPLIKLYKKMEKIFLNMGFSVVQGPEIELDCYNFEKLNMPPHHPARDMQDTFYISSPEVLLRSHTSCVQIRTMESIKPPFQIISPGTVYRVDDIDPQHTPMFYQVEGLVISENASFANLKSILIKLLREIFGREIGVRFRPSYYPYTEPSAAIDMSCIKCDGQGCQTCSGAGWITVLGSGMVHYKVLREAGIDSERYIGFAFGLGLNRLALLYYDLNEIRKIYENDVSIWRQL